MHTVMYNILYIDIGGEFVHLFEALHQGLVNEGYVNNSVSRLIKAMIRKISVDGDIPMGLII